MSSVEVGYLEDVVRRVAAGLIEVYARRAVRAQCGVVFPKKRDGTFRVSEQEAKVLFLQHLHADGQFCFSVETPTDQTYRFVEGDPGQQGGGRRMSARVDITIWESMGAAAANVEFKAHNCLLRYIRKDVEKLLREKRVALWFHTLSAADLGTLPALLRKFRRSFGELSEHLGDLREAWLVCFCILDAGVLYSRWLRFPGTLAANLANIETVFGAKTFDAATWRVDRFGSIQRAAVSVPTGDKRSSGKGVRAGFFVFIPSFTRNTFLHLSVRGGSYRLRDFVHAGPGTVPIPFTMPGYRTFGALQTSGTVAAWQPVAANDYDHGLETETLYWYERLCQVNQQMTHVLNSAGPPEPSANSDTTAV